MTLNPLVFSRMKLTDNTIPSYECNLKVRRGAFIKGLLPVTCTKVTDSHEWEEVDGWCINKSRTVILKSVGWMVERSTQLDPTLTVTPDSLTFFGNLSRPYDHLVVSTDITILLSPSLWSKIIVLCKVFFSSTL